MPTSPPLRMRRAGPGRVPRGPPAASVDGSGASSAIPGGSLSLSRQRPWRVAALAATVCGCDPTVIIGTVVHGDAEADGRGDALGDAAVDAPSDATLDG